MRRPVCVLCILMILGIVLLKKQEFFPYGKTPVSFSAGEEVPLPDEAGEVLVSGIVEERKTAGSTEICYLKETQVLRQGLCYESGRLKVVLREKRKLPLGSLVKLRGTLSRITSPVNPWEYDERNAEACRHVFYCLEEGRIQEVLERNSAGELLLRLREKLSAVLEQHAGGQAGVFQAMLLGDRSDLEKETKTLYQMAGILHILAVSGLHLSILGMGFFRLLRRLGIGNGPAGAAALFLVFHYGILTGAGTATLRAVIMMSLSIGGKILGRVYDLPTALAVGALLLLLDSPDYLENSGFLFSFAAVLGMAVVYPVLKGTLEPRRKGVDALLSSLSVTLVTLPVTLYFYYEVSWGALLLNLLILPTVGAVLYSGLAGLLLCLAGIPGGALAFLPGELLLRLYEFLCRISLELPGGLWVAGRPEGWAVGLYYGVLLGLLLYLHGRDRKRKRRRRSSPPPPPESRGRRRAELLLAGVVLCPVIGLLGFHGPRSFSLTCLDVGQGDCIVMETKQGEIFLCDGGSSSVSSVGSSRILPYLKYMGYGRVDGIFVTHTDQDHDSGILEILEAQRDGLSSVTFGCLYLPDWESPPEAYGALLSAAEQADVPVRRLTRGDLLRTADTELRVLHPARGTFSGDTNDSCLVLEVESGGCRCLLMGDAGVETEERLLELLRPCQILKAGHHGSSTSSGERFLDRVQPAAALISCGENNAYGHPHRETLQRLEDRGTAVFATKDAGTVTVRAAEDGIRIRTYGDFPENG